MTPTTSPRLLRLPDVCAWTGLSKSEIYRRIKEKTFSAPTKLGARAVAWTDASINDWIYKTIQNTESKV